MSASRAIVVRADIDRKFAAAYDAFALDLQTQEPLKSLFVCARRETELVFRGGPESVVAVTIALTDLWSRHPKVCRSFTVLGCDAAQN